MEQGQDNCQQSHLVFHLVLTQNLRHFPLLHFWIKVSQVEAKALIAAIKTIFRLELT